MDIMSYLMGQNNAIKKGMKVEVVTELPETGVANVIYLVPKEDTGDNDIFDEYLWIDDNWEHIGSTDIDLSNYYTKSEVNNLVTSPELKNIPFYEVVTSFDSPNSQWPLDNDAKTRIGNIFTDAFAKGYKVVNIFIRNTRAYGPSMVFTTEGSTFNVDNYKPSGEIILNSYLRRYGGFQFLDNAATYSAFGGYLSLTLSWSGDTCTCTRAILGSAYAQLISSGNLARTLSDYLAKTNTTAYTPTTDYHPATKKYVDDITGALASLNTTDKTSLVNAINEVLAGSGGNSEAVKVLYLDDYSSSSNALDMSKFETGLYIILRKREGNTMYMKPRASASARGLQNATGFNNLTLLLYSNQLPETYDSNARGFTIFQLNPNSFGYWVYTDYNTYFDAAWNTVVESVSVANNQTITGTKNFSTLPVSSVTPTFNNQLVNKQYVDDSIASAITDALGGSY